MGPRAFFFVLSNADIFPQLQPFSLGLLAGVDTKWYLRRLWVSRSRVQAGINASAYFLGNKNRTPQPSKGQTMAPPVCGQRCG